MTETKQKKLIMASTVTAVLLAVILLVVMCYQLISMSVLKNKRARLKSEIEQLKQIVQTTTDEVEKWEALEWIEKKARELGMYYDGDKEFGR